MDHTAAAKLSATRLTDKRGDHGVVVQARICRNITAFEYDLCEEDVSVRKAIGRAIDQFFPLSLPDDKTLFDNDLLYRFCPSCET